MAWYTPTRELSESAREDGLKYMFYDGLCSHAMTLLVTGAFLPGMALALGAGNFVIGLLASLAPMSQMMQIPAILLVERIAMRKLITVVLALISRLALLSTALIPFFAPEGFGVPLFLLAMILFFVGGSAAGCSWNSWIKDIVPEKTMGSYLAKRLAAATALGALLTVIAGFGIDGLTEALGEPSRAYGIVFFVAAICGIYGAKLLSKVPEPQMPPRIDGARFFDIMSEPLRDANFRRLLAFSGAWSFTVIMAGAFFAVYMLKRIGLPMSAVILLAVLSQVTNIYWFKLWGKIADRYNNKAVLRISVPLFIVVILLYPFTTMPERYALTIPLLIFIHILGGISTAGFNLCAANIALRLAPKGKATAYLATNAFCSGLAATIAPIAGGVIGSFFAMREISLRLFYHSNIDNPDALLSIPALSFRGVDFIFFAAAIVGIYAWHRLSMIEEEGTIIDSEVRDEVFNSLRSSLINPASLTGGVRRMSAFPYDMLRKTTKSTSSTIYKVARAGYEQATSPIRSAKHRESSDSENN